MTQQHRLLQAFQDKGELYVYEIMAPRPNGLGISQYGARIKELREQGHQIINKQPGHFVYHREERETMPDVTKSQGYQRFQQMGLAIQGKADKPVTTKDYHDKSAEELKVLKEAAEKWLKENELHQKYDEALARYERIVNELNYREAQEVFDGLSQKNG